MGLRDPCPLERILWKVQMDDAGQAASDLITAYAGTRCLLLEYDEGLSWHSRDQRIERRSISERQDFIAFRQFTGPRSRGPSWKYRANACSANHSTAVAGECCLPALSNTAGNGASAGPQVLTALTPLISESAPSGKDLMVRLGCVPNYMKRLHKGLVRRMILGRGFDLWQVPATT